MITSTLRNWGGAVAVSLPKKILGVLGLAAGAQVQLRVEDGNIVLSPSRGRYTLEQLEKEQRALDNSRDRLPHDARWLASSARGKELL